MRASTIGLTVAAIAAVLTGSACAVILGRYAPGISPIMIFMEMSPVPKVIAIFINLITIGVFTLGLVGLVAARWSGSRRGVIEIMLWLAAVVCTVFGVLAALYGELNTQIAIKAVGPVSFAVTAPSRAEALLALTIGLAGAAFAMAFVVGIVNLRLTGRPRPAS